MNHGQLTTFKVVVLLLSVRHFGLVVPPIVI